MLAAAAGAWLRMLGPLAGLLAFVVVGFLVIAWLRRGLTDHDRTSNDDEFTLDGLRRMRADGRITNDEFEAARAAIIARVRGSDTSENDGVPASKPDETN
jgi:hypothetical protein